MFDDGEQMFLRQHSRKKVAKKLGLLGGGTIEACSVGCQKSDGKKDS